MINYISKDLHEISIMTDNSDLKFCVHCGAELDDGAMFCKSCGAQVERSDAPVTMNPYASMKENSMNNRLKVIGICCIVYAVLAIIGGIIFLVSIDSLMEQVITDPSWPEAAQQLIDMGVVTDLAGAESFMRDVFTYTGYFGVIIGIITIIPAYSCFTKKAYIPGLVGMVISTVLSAASVIGLIIGVVFVVLYCSCSDAFKKQTF